MVRMFVMGTNITYWAFLDYDAQQIDKVSFAPNPNAQTLSQRRVLGFWL